MKDIHRMMMAMIVLVMGLLTMANMTAMTTVGKR